MTQGVGSRLIAGAIGGIVGTVAMTAAMRRLHSRLPAAEQYPLPPREITERLLPFLTDEETKDASLLSHVAFGAVAGAGMATAHATSALKGSGWGVLVWLASYFGWVPGGKILRPADEHPARRNALMIFVHLIWGSVAAISARELLAARETMLAAGPHKDVHGDQAR